MKIFAEERHNKIAELINNRGRITVPELAKEFEISEITIRRDLKELEDRGLITRTHGGAIKNIKSSYELYYEEQLSLRIEEKKRIARFATRFLDHNDSIILEASTTNVYFSDFIGGDKNLKIFTNSPAIITNLRKLDKDTEVYCSGGILKKDTNCLTGYDTIAFFRNLKADKAFISIGALNEEKIMTIASRDELEVKKSILESANKLIALSDSSKFGSTLLYEIGKIDLLDILVTDGNIDRKLLKYMLESGVEVYTV